MKRVVVTGLGIVSPLACGVEPTWRKLLAGESAAAKVENFDVSDLPCQIAAQVPRGAAPDAFNPDEWMEPKEQRRVDDFIVYAISAATQALRDAGWAPKTYEEEIETGVLIGSGIGGLEGIAETAIILHEKGPRRVSPFFIPGRLINLASGHVSIMHNLKGPNHSVVTACSTGAHAIGDAARLVALGDADRHGRWRRRIGGQSSLARRVRGMPRAVDGFQRPAEAGFPALRSRPRRVRDGRGRRLRRRRGLRACEGARRENLCRGGRLWPFGRRLSHYRALAGRRRRLSRDGRGDEARGDFGVRPRLCQRPRHIDAGRRRD